MRVEFEYEVRQLKRQDGLVLPKLLTSNKQLEFEKTAEPAEEFVPKQAKEAKNA